MENDAANQEKSSEKKSGFMTFLLKRVVVALVLIAVVMWALAVGVDYLEKPAPWKDRWVKGDAPIEANRKPAEGQTPAQPGLLKAETEMPRDQEGIEHRMAQGEVQTMAELEAALPSSRESHDQRSLEEERHQQATREEAAATKNDDAHPAAVTPPKEGETAASHDAESAHATESGQPAGEPLPKGVTFVNAVIQPIEYELTERFWGWRPNDIINITDNVNNFQLGVLEVTRRTAVQLTERISRTGSTDAFNKNLENAMNWLMVKADRYWFPSPEAKYKESLAELRLYRDELMIEEASFHTRTDNLIPLLAAFEDLLGSCDENLVKTKETDGTEIGFFKADNYFYYAKGVASAMESILEAIHHDFELTIVNRHGEELLHHAIVSCRTAASLDPWLITNADLDGILANHRANMAAPISHARFYIGQLIETLST